MLHLRNCPLLFIALVVLATHGCLGPAITEWPWPACAAAGLAVLLAGMACLGTAGIDRAGRNTLFLIIAVIGASLIRIRTHHDAVFGKSAIPAGTAYSGELTVSRILKSSDTWLILQGQNLRLATEDSVRYPDRYILLRIYQPGDFRCLPGDELHVLGRTEPIEGALNPKSWDMRRYYTNLGMRNAMFLRREAVVHTGRTHFNLLRAPAKWQRWLSSQVNRQISSSSAQLTNALVWGDRADMNPEIRNAFAGAGAMHVLSVSGMHVAMVYSALWLILGQPGRGSPTRNLLRLLTYWTAIATYVLVTGASPAAVRSGLMIMLYLGGKSFARETQVWNLMGLAALIQWWIEPGILDQLGFQLSFLAMAGILLYTKPILQAWPIRRRWAHWVWQVTSLSLAAQIFILPLLLYHFHQFPFTFILSSLVAVPAGYVIIFGSMACLVFSAFGIDVLWSVYDRAAEWFIRSMAWMADMNPVMHSAFPRAALVTAMAAILLVSLGWLYRWKQATRPALAAGMLCLLCLASHRTVQWERDELVIYHTRKGVLIDWFSAGTVTTLHTADLAPSAQTFAAGGYRAFKDIRPSHTSADRFTEIPGDSSACILSLTSGFHLLLWTGGTYDLTHSSVDAILVTAVGDRCALENIILSQKVPVILAACLSTRDKRTVERMLNYSDINNHDIGADGAYIHRT